MRGLVKAGVLLAPALAGTVTLPEEDTIPSAFITLHLPQSDQTTSTPVRDVVFRFDIHESVEACGLGNVTIDGHPLPEGGSGALTVQDDRVIDAAWNFTCVTWNDVPQEQLLSLNVESVDGNPVEDVGFTVRFQQIAPVWISDVEGAVSMTRVHSITQPKPDCHDDNELDVDAELAELDYLRWQVHELHQKIFEKERRLFEAFGPPAHDGHHGRPHHGRPPMIGDCDSLRCVMEAVFHKVKVAAWPFAGDFGPGPHGPPPPPPGPWGRHHGHSDHPHGPPPFGHGYPFPEHQHSEFGQGHHGNHTKNGTHPHHPHFGHPPPFCRCPPSDPHDEPHGPPPHGPPPHGPHDGPHDDPHHGPHDGPHDGHHGHPEGPPHGPPDGFPHMPPPPPHGMEPGSPFPPPPPGPPAHEPHGFGWKSHHGSEPEEQKMRPEGMDEAGRPESEGSEHKGLDMDKPEVAEAELRRDFYHPGRGHHGSPHDFEGKHHDGPHHPPHDFDGHHGGSNYGAPHDGPPPPMHDGPEGIPPPPPFAHDGPPPPPPPPSHFDGSDHGPDHRPPPPPPPPGPHRHHRGPPGLLFIHIASVAASVVLLGVFVRVLHQRYVRRSPAFSHRRRRSSSNAPWFKKLFYGPHYQELAQEEKEAMLRDCDSDCGSVSGGDDDVIARDSSNFRTAADVVGEMVAVEEGRMMVAGSHSRESSQASMAMPQQYHQQQMFAPVMPQPLPMQVNSVPMPISAEAAAMFPDLHHDDMAEELPAYQESDRSDDDDASELASSLMADGYRPGCSGSYTPSESGSQGASDILGDTKN